MPENTEASPQSGAALLARVRPRLREESTRLCLRPDLLDAWEAATDALAEAEAKDKVGDRLASGISKSTRDLAAEVARLEEEIAQNEAVFRFRAMPKDAWQALTAEHPPRKDNQADAFYGSNRDAVLDAAVRVSMIDPVFEDCELQGCEHEDCGSWQQFLAVCNPSEWVELRNTVNRVNSAVVDPPKSEQASRILSSSASGSRPRKRGASAPASSTAG